MAKAALNGCFLSLDVKIDSLQANMKHFEKYFYLIYNRLKFYFLGCKFGQNMRIYNSIYVLKKTNAQICIGDNFTCSSGGGYNPIVSNVKGYIRADENANICIGNNCGFSSAVVWSKVCISIGDNVLLGGGVLIMDSDIHSLDFQYRNGEKRDELGRNKDVQSAKAKAITIENDVLVGARSIILKGVTIGARSVIGAGSVVTKDIPSDVVAGGNPCVVLKKITREQ